MRSETSEKSSARSSVSGGSLSNKLTRTPHGTREPSFFSVSSALLEEYVASSRYRKGYENVLVYRVKKHSQCQKHKMKHCDRYTLIFSPSKRTSSRVGPPGTRAMSRLISLQYHLFYPSISPGVPSSGLDDYGSFRPFVATPF